MRPGGLAALCCLAAPVACASALADVASLVQLAASQRSNFSAAADLGPAALGARALALSGSAQGTAESASLSGAAPAEPVVPRRRFARGDVAPAALAERPTVVLLPEPLDMETLVPTTWACIGPVAAPELGVDPITAFGEIKPTMIKGLKALEATMALHNNRYTKLRQGRGRNHSDVMEELAHANQTQPSKNMQDNLPQFPTEYGPGGKTIWAIAHTNMEESKVAVNFTEAARAAGITDAAINDVPKSGWAVATMMLSHDSAVLIRCNEAFMLDNDLVLKTPDAYEERRAISVYHLRKGEHRLYLRFRQAPFWCDIHEDTAEGRRNVTLVKKQAEAEAPLAVLSDAMLSDVVEGRIASPYLAVPVVNVAAFPVRLGSPELVAGPPGLALQLLPGKEGVEIAAGQSYVAGLMLSQGSKLLRCEDGRPNSPELQLSMLLHTERSDGQALSPVNVTVTARCVAPRDGGYKVTFPDYDDSVQHMWVAPPNVTGLPRGSCPPTGCPALLSLHGANVIVSPNWGHNYARSGESGSPFPYPAWLVEPSNRYHWGTDWEGPGYDNGIAALDYVRTHLPGISTAEKRRMRLDPDRLLLTGHSMGGHGSFVFSVHDPDRLLGTLSGAGWTSQARYVRTGGSALLDEAESGLLKARMAEHAADLLARNFRGVPLKVVYGDKDENVPPREPRYMARLVDSYSGSARAVMVSELPGVGHWFTQNIPEVATFLGRHLSPVEDPSEDANASWILPPLPTEFEFTVASVSSFGTKGNLKVLQLADAARPGRLFVRRCKWGGGDLSGACASEPVWFRNGGSEEEPPRDDETSDAVWYVETSNVRRLTFRNPRVRGRPLPQVLVVDGSPVNTSSFTESAGQHLCLVRPGAQAVEPEWKVCGDTRWESIQRAGPKTEDGPFHNVLRRARLCIAHGSGPGQAELALVVANKLYFVSRYAVPIIPAVHRNMTGRVPDYCKSANMLFIGHPQDNSLLDEERCAFPYMTFHDAPSPGFTLGGMAYRGPGVGLIAMGRLSTSRLAMVILGTDGDGLVRAGDRLPVTSFRDGADYMVMGRDASWQGEGGVLAAGYLDPLWRVSSSGWAEPEHSVARWDGISLDGSPEDPRCAEVRAMLLESDQEIAEKGRAAARCGCPLLISVILAGLLHLLSLQR